VSDAQVAETAYTAFTSAGRTHRVSARLIVRRVKRLNPGTVPAGQHELFAAYRHHAVFTNSTASMLTAEAEHRDHAIVEQVRPRHSVQVQSLDQRGSHHARSAGWADTRQPAGQPGSAPWAGWCRRG